MVGSELAHVSALPPEQIFAPAALSVWGMTASWHGHIETRHRPDLDDGQANYYGTPDVGGTVRLESGNPW